MKTIVITGTRKGIGKEMAKHYLAEDWKSSALPWRRQYRARPLPTLSLDVSDEDAVIAMARKIKASHGDVDALLNNAAIASMNHALLTPASTVNHILQTNVVASFFFVVKC